MAPWQATFAGVESLLQSHLARRLRAAVQHGARSVRLGVRILGVSAGLAVSANNSADLAAVLVNDPLAIRTGDPRYVRLEEFFERYRCPGPQNVEAYLRAADYYELDYRLLPALSVRETTCGLLETQNNRWGYRAGRKRFPSVVAGIYYVARQLAEGPAYRGKTLAGKLHAYNPRPGYPSEVERIIRQIE